MIPREHQRVAISRLKTGSILYGGVGSGKSLTSLMYYKEKEFPKKLYIITTAAKRDSGDWEKESTDLANITRVDSWNNISKYIGVTDSFFIFDEQRVVGSGAWVKSFLKITKNNTWILLSATPGDTWMDYIPVFVANGYYKNRTEFIRRHIAWNNFTKFPKVDHYLETGRLLALRASILVPMSYKKETTAIVKDILLSHNIEKYELVMKKRWNPYNNIPVKEVGELCYVARRVINSDESRLARITTIIDEHKKVIVFYNFNYELEILKSLSNYPKITVAEYNGHKHDPIPKTDMWAYLVQYTAGAEGWNCIETNTIAFYSLNYSHRIMVQAAGRIDRINTSFSNLYYYRLVSNASIDVAILKALKNKKNFNESGFLNSRMKLML